MLSRKSQRVALLALCVSLQGGHQTAQAITTSLQLHTTLDAADISGTTVNDTAGAPQNGAIVGAVPQVAGKISGAVDFTASDANSVNFGNVLNPGAGSYTVSAWFNADSIGGGAEVYLGKGNASSGLAGWTIFEESGTLVVRGGIGGTGVGQRFSQNISLANAQVGNGQWHHVALVIDRATDTITGYLDGSNGGFVNGGGGPTSNTITAASAITNADALIYGRRSTTGAPMDGRLDDVAIFDRALSPTEIATIVAAGNAATPRNIANAEVGPMGGIFAAAVADRDAFVDSAAPNTNRNDLSGANGHLGGLVISAEDSPLLHFDLTGITTGPVQVVPGSARLVLFETDAGLNVTGITGHELLADWMESTVTFNTLPAFNAANLFGPVGHVQGVNSFSGPALDALVQQWLNNPASNFGLILTAGGAEDAYRSRHQAEAPRLEFEFTPVVVPEPASAGLLLIGGLALLRRRKPHPAG
jgi:hypothetical protein